LNGVHAVNQQTMFTRKLGLFSQNHNEVNRIRNKTVPPPRVGGIREA